MYPFLRMAKELIKFRKAPKLGIFDLHESTHICWPWDLDIWAELNNGCTLTLYDLGRMPMATRMGFDRIAREKRWGLVVAGASVRYRRRVTMFNRITMKSRLIGWDDRFLYLEQAMWVRGECTSHSLLRSAITQNRRGIVPPAELSQALGLRAESPPLPGWVVAWANADAQRPWPPMA